MAGLIDEVLVNDLEASNLNDMVKTDKLEPKVEEKVETKPVEDDEFTECDEYARSDGKTCSICLACTDELEAMNKIKSFRVV